jgi:hypothetical protein
MILLCSKVGWVSPIGDSFPARFAGRTGGCVGHASEKLIEDFRKTLFSKNNIWPLNSCATPLGRDAIQ